MRRDAWQVLRLDELQRPTPEGAWDEWTDEQCAARCVDTDRLRALLHSLRLGQRVSFRAYDWLTHEEGEDLRTFEPEGVLLVEGTYSLRDAPPIRYDLTAWVTVNHSERMRRIAARPEPAPGWLTAWLRGERWYAWVGEPATDVDAVLSGQMTL